MKKKWHYSFVWRAYIKKQLSIKEKGELMKKKCLLMYCVEMSVLEMLEIVCDDSFRQNETIRHVTPCLYSVLIT